MSAMTVNTGSSSVIPALAQHRERVSRRDLPVVVEVTDDSFSAVERAENIKLYLNDHELVNRYRIGCGDLNASAVVIKLEILLLRENVSCKSR